MKLVTLLIAVLTLSCKSHKSGASMDKENDRLVLLLQEGFFPVEQPETYVIKDQKTLRTLFSRINRTRKPGLPVPDVDFTEHDVLVACLGQIRTSGKPEMRIHSETENEITIAIALKDMESQGATIAHPLCLYQISKSEKEIKFLTP